MRIVSIETFVLRQRLPEPFGYSQAWYETRTAMLVRDTTDDGQCGWGEAFGPPEPAASVVQHVLAPLVLCENPLDTLPLWERMYARTRDYGQKGLVIHVISAVDIALWDLKGELLNTSVSRLIGGRFRDSVRAYATGLYFRSKEDFVEELVAEASGHVSAGFTAVKLKIGFTPERDIAHARAIRAAIGDGIELMVDANHAYDRATAIRVGRAIEPLDIRWYEEPVIPEDVSAYLDVRRALSIPIAGGEAEFTRFGFRELLARGAVDIVQPDLTITGGFTECQRIAALSSAYGVRYLPHVWGSAVGLAASLQLIASLPPNIPSFFPQEPLLEFDRTPNAFRDELATEPTRQSSGWVPIPDRPGLGVSIDGKVLAQYLVDHQIIRLSDMTA